MIPIFLLSDFRSGSTLLRYVLDAHPDVCCPAELRLAAFCQSAYSVAELTVPEGYAPRSELSRRRLLTVRRLVDEMLKAYCELKGKERWCDKSPANLHQLYMLSSVFPDAQYICLYRHGLDQVRSFLEVNGTALHKTYLARHKGDALSAGIDRWCTQTEKLLAFEHAHPTRTLRVAYEQFVKAPEEQAIRLLEFLRLRTVSGLPVAAFQRQHDRGPSDHKIAATSEVLRDRVGRGGALALDGVPSALRQRMARLLRTLGYSSTLACEFPTPRDQALN